MDPLTLLEGSAAGWAPTAPLTVNCIHNVAAFLIDQPANLERLEDEAAWIVRVECNASGRQASCSTTAAARAERLITLLREHLLASFVARCGGGHDDLTGTVATGEAALARI